MKSNRYKKVGMPGRPDDSVKEREISRLRQELAELLEVIRLIQDVVDEVAASGGSAEEVCEKISQRIDPKYSLENIREVRRAMDAECVLSAHVTQYPCQSSR